MLDNPQLKIYVWSGPIRMVGHFDSPMDAARKLFRKIMDREQVEIMDDKFCVSFMSFERSLLEFHAGDVLGTMKLGINRDDD